MPLKSFFPLGNDAAHHLHHLRKTDPVLCRILCNIIGQWVEDGEYPNDEKALEKIIKGICFDNAKRYFNL